MNSIPQRSHARFLGRSFIAILSLTVLAVFITRFYDGSHVDIAAKRSTISVVQAASPTPDSINSSITNKDKAAKNDPYQDIARKAQNIIANDVSGANIDSYECNKASCIIRGSVIFNKNLAMMNTVISQLEGKYLESQMLSGGISEQNITIYPDDENHIRYSVEIQPLEN